MIYGASVLLPGGRAASFIPAPRPRPDNESWAIDVRRSERDGMALLDSNLDNTLNFRNHFKIALKGSNDDFSLEGVDVGNPEVYAEVTDPVSFQTFRAVNTADGHGYGFRLVTEAKTILEQEWMPAKEALDGTDPADPAYAATLAAFRDAELRLNDRIEFMEDLRILHRSFIDNN